MGSTSLQQLIEAYYELYNTESNLEVQKSVFEVNIHPTQTANVENLES